MNLDYNTVHYDKAKSIFYDNTIQRQQTILLNTAQPYVNLQQAAADSLALVSNTTAVVEVPSPSTQISLD